jgi:hypothetical protein
MEQQLDMQRMLSLMMLIEGARPQQFRKFMTLIVNVECCPFRRFLGFGDF